MCGQWFRIRLEYRNHMKIYHNRSGTGWSKGLTKETCPSIRQQSETYKKHLNDGIITPSFLGKRHTFESRQKMSESKKQFLILNPNKIPWKTNTHLKISYPEKYFIELFLKENIPLKYHLQVSIYQLDFYNEEKKFYVEIDGEQHYTSNSLRESDKKRDEYFKSIGWTGIRIRWKDYSKLSLNNKCALIESIRQKLI